MMQTTTEHISLSSPLSPSCSCIWDVGRTHHVGLAISNKLFVDSHFRQYFDTSLAHRISADLVPRELLLLQQQHLFSFLGQVVCRRGTGRTSTDNHSIVKIGSLQQNGTHKCKLESASCSLITQLAGVMAHVREIQICISLASHYTVWTAPISIRVRVRVFIL